MSKEHDRRIARLEASSLSAPMTAIGVVPAYWTEEEANQAIMRLAKAEGHAGPLEPMALKDTALIEPVLLDVCDFSALLRFVASQGRRITDPVEVRYEH